MQVLKQAQLQALPLPDGWVEMLDEGSGQPYYYNDGTGETSWEPPLAAVSTEAVLLTTTPQAPATQAPLS